MMTSRSPALSRVLARIRLAGWLILGGGLLLHLTIRDRVDYVATVFYALPLPVLAGLSLLLAAWRRWRRAALVLAAGITAGWISRSWCAHQPPPAAAGSHEFRALYWNMGRPAGPSADLIDLVKRLQPDVAGCGEPGREFMQEGAAYEQALPGYTCHLMPRGLILLSRWPVRMRGRGRLDDTGAFAFFDVSAPQGLVRLVLVDVWADPLLPRHRSLNEALSYAGGDARCIVMGDFNTPAESVWFEPYRRARLQDAFETAGRGFRETWFWRLPVLSLDHIWAGKDWRVLEAQKIHRWSSDHAAIFVRLQP
ncbi:MAG: endonuclease/exonuclease/phosphatase family protein [Verrucomicrobiaceae bacterium]|nr:endonuclease/exonuclease/phosphatase family protein [Verrucomicrobiaceae bacterium]